MPDILVTENITGSAMDALRGRFDVLVEPQLWKDPTRLRQMAADAKAIMVRNQTAVNAELIAAAKQLQVIARAGVGLDNVDTETASNAGIVVVYAPEQNSISVAELALGMMLALARMIPAADRSTRGGGWERNRFVGTELYGKALGLVGFGRIGFLTAMRARAFGMDVVAHDTYVSPDAFTVSEARARLVGLDELLASADFVSCHTPETPQTAGLFTYERFCRMKPSGYFVNTSRGGVVDEAGLLRALREKRIAGAALDVRAKEPPAAGELETMENVVLVPHVGAFTVEGQERVVNAVCRDVEAVLSGRPAKNCFNFPKPNRR